MNESELRDILQKIYDKTGGLQTQYIFDGPGKMTEVIISGACKTPKSEKRAAKAWENVVDVDKWLKDLRNGDL
jgi:hypothetical protein